MHNYYLNLRAAAMAVAMAVCALGASAQSVADERFQEIVLPGALDTHSPALSHRAESAPASPTGYYAEYDYIQTGTAREGFTAMPQLTVGTDGTATLTNFYNLGTLTGTYDATSATITFPHQVVYTMSPYGDFEMVYFDAVQWGYSTAKNLVFTWDDAEGCFTLGSGWAVLVTDKTSEYVGSALAMSTTMRLYPSNATLTGSLRDLSAQTFSDTSYPVFVKQTTPTQALIANLANSGREVTVFLNADGTFTLEPQMMSYTSLTATSYVTYPAEWGTGTYGNKGIPGNITGTLSATGFGFGPWGVFAATTSSASTSCLYGMNSSTISVEPGVLTLPSSQAYSFTGSGTEADPYQIASTADLDLLAAAVASGLTYEGKYFKQTADIDFASYVGQYRPVGADATNCFNGTYDGGNYTIKNFYVERSAEYTGIFGYVGASGVVRGVKMTTARMLTYGRYSGFVAGYSLGRIEDCSVSGQLVTYERYAGGIVGYSTYVSGCHYVGYLTGLGQLGGITGMIYRGTIKDCSAQISAKQSVPSTSIEHGLGGIVGACSSASASPVLIENCYVLGTMYDTSSYGWVGGIAGNLVTYCTLRSCAASVMIQTVATSSNGYAGGLVGYSSGATIEDCVASCYVQGTSTGTRLGGIAGYLSNLASNNNTLTRVISTGQVYGNGQTLVDNGVAGVINDGTIFNNVYVDGQMAGTLTADHYTATDSLTTANGPEGFGSDMWTFTAGRYPTPKWMAADVAGYFGAAIHLGQGQTSSYVKTAFTLDTPSDVAWYLLDDDNAPVLSHGALTISGSDVTLTGDQGKEFISARFTTDAGTFTRLYQLNVSPSQFPGSGTEADPFVLRTVDDLRTLNTGVTSNGLHYTGDYFVLGNDIDLTGVTDFYGIGDDTNETHYFDATLDGRGYTIKNWTMNGLTLDSSGSPVASSSRQTVALVGILGPNGHLKDITMDASCSLKGYAGLAAFVAICNGTVENCRNYADITVSANYVGGICTRLNAGARAINCYNAGTITAGYRYAAGIVGQMYGGSTISGCQNDGYVHTDAVTNAYEYASTGGAAGIVFNSDATSGADACVIENCVNQGTVQAYTIAAGIIGGVTSAAQLRGCVNTGIVICEGGTYCGAFGGQVASAPAVLEACYYDNQLCTLGAMNGLPRDGISAVNTSVLTTGTAIEGLSADIFDYAAGKYPVLKARASETAASTLRSMYVTFGDGQTVGSMTTNAQLSKADGLTWSIPASEYFSIAGDTLKVTGCVQPQSITLVGTSGAFTREYAVTAFFAPFAGSGTEADPFLITCAADLITLSDYTNTYGLTFEGNHFAITADLDFTGIPQFTPIGFDSNSFGGIIDGRNHSINYLTIDRTDRSVKPYQYVAIIGTLTDKGAVRNLRLGTCSIAAYYYVSALVDKCYGTIENVVNEDATLITTMTTAADVGGLVRYLYAGGSIINCVNRANLDCSGTSMGGIVEQTQAGSLVKGCVNYGNITCGKTTAGGIAARCGGDMIDCKNYGVITASGYIGGIASTMTGGGLYRDLENFGELVFTSAGAGGICYSASGTFINCVNHVDVRGENYLGGCFGSFTAACTVDSCVNYGTVIGNKTYVGGVIGQAGSYANVVTNCVNYGDSVYSNYYDLGGVIGNGNGASAVYRNLVNYATVVNGSATPNNAYAVGGVFGNISGTITDCVNYGTVMSVGNRTGGIAGTSQSSHISSCINLGSVTSTRADRQSTTTAYGHVGGISGYATTGNIHDCANYGTLTGEMFVGGICGASTGATLRRNIAYGKINCTDGTTCAAAMYCTSTQTKVSVDSCYYSTDVNPALVQDEYSASFAKGLTDRELITTSLSDLWDYHQYAMPTLKAFADVPEANFHAALLVFSGDDTAEGVTDKIHVAYLPGLTWEASEEFFIDADEGIIHPLQEASGRTGTITLRAGDLVRVYTIKLGNVIDGIEAVGADDATVVAVRYFNLQGVQIANPAPGTVVVEQTVYSDGTARSRTLRK